MLGGSGAYVSSSGNFENMVHISAFWTFSIYMYFDQIVS